MQEYSYKGKLIIGVDHGYGNMKTAHRVFMTGLDAMEQEPIVSTNYLKYKDMYYVIGETHLTYQGDKTDTEDFFILTLAALAEELKFRNIYEADIYLAAGLPLAWAKSQANDFSNYLMRESDLQFEFRKEKFRIHISGTVLFPQGFAAICQAGNMKGFNMIADIGNGTMNVMQINDGRPLEKSLITEKFGVSCCMKEIQNELTKDYAGDVSEAMIEPLLRNGCSGRTDIVAKKTEHIAGKYAAEIMKRLVNYGYKEGLVNLHIVGGGGCLLKHYTDIAGKQGVTFIDDICANAKGYEFLAIKKMKAMERRN